MTILKVARFVASKQDGARRIKTGAQRSAKHTINELGEERGRARLDHSALQFGRERGVGHVIGVERKDPLALNHAETVVPLLGMSIKRSLMHLHIRKLAAELDRVIAASAVEHHDSLRPTKRLKCARDVRRLVKRQDKWRNLPKVHLDCSRRQQLVTVRTLLQPRLKRPSENEVQ